MTDQCRHDITIDAMRDAIVSFRERLAGDDVDRLHTKEVVDRLSNALVDLANKIDKHTSKSIDNKNELITLINANKTEMDLKIETEIKNKKWFDFWALIGSAGTVMAALIWVINIYLSNYMIANVSPISQQLKTLNCLIVKKYPDYASIIKCPTD